MEQRKLLITGGTGFFGKALLRHFLLTQNSVEAPARIVVLSRDPEEFLKVHPEFKLLKALELKFGDITLPQTLPIIEGITHFIHAATDSTIGPSMEPLQRYRQIVHGTENILEFAVRCGAKRFLLTSSGGVYGPQPLDLPNIDESWHSIPDPLNPDNCYSIGKRAAEHLCALYSQSYNLEIVIARCFAFVGKDLPLDEHFAIGNFIRDALDGKQIIVKGDGSPIRSYMDQRDLAEWLTALVYRGQNGSAYNVGSDSGISIKNLAYLVRECVGLDINILIQNNKVANSFRSRYVPSIELATNTLGLSLKYSLQQSILAVVDAVRSR